LTANVAPPRQKAAEERNFSPKARVESASRRERRPPRGSATKKHEKAMGVERIGAEREGGGKAGRSGIDRLKKGWIFLPLGGGPAV